MVGTRLNSKPETLNHSTEALLDILMKNRALAEALIKFESTVDRIQSSTHLPKFNTVQNDNKWQEIIKKIAPLQLLIAEVDQIIRLNFKDLKHSNLKDIRVKHTRCMDYWVRLQCDAITIGFQ